MDSFDLNYAGSTGGAEELTDKFLEYTKYNTRPIPELVEKQSKELADALYLETPRAREEDIRAAVEELGWGLKRPSIKDVTKAAIAFSRGKSGKTKGALTLEEFKDYIAFIRISHIGALAAGWIPAMQALGSKLAVAGGSRRKGSGRVEIDLSGDNPTVVIVNSTKGIVELNARTDILGRAFKRVIDNMDVYIERKKRELSNIFNPSGEIT